MTRQSDSGVIGLYEYDPIGRRTKKTLEDDSSVRYYHDGHHEVEEYDGSGSLLRKYVYRDDIDSIAMMEAPDQADVDADLNTSELVRLFYHCDGRTNVAWITAAAQNVVESYESDPYGNVTIKNQGGSSVSTSPVGNPFVFQRRRHDAESGLMYFRARHYDPQRGHWMQRDPLGFGPGANWREFCSSSPVARRDPLGMCDEDCPTEHYVFSSADESKPLVRKVYIESTSCPKCKHPHLVFVGYGNADEPTSPEPGSGGGRRGGAGGGSDSPPADPKPEAPVPEAPPDEGEGKREEDDSDGREDDSIVSGLEDLLLELVFAREDEWGRFDSGDDSALERILLLQDMIDEVYREIREAKR